MRWSSGSGSGSGQAGAPSARESATDEVSLALGLKKGAPVQYLEQVTYLRDGRPIEYSDIWINSTLLRVTSLLLRH